MPGSDRPVRPPTPGPSRPSSSRQRRPFDNSPYDHSTRQDGEAPIHDDADWYHPDSRQSSRQQQKPGFTQPVNFVPSYDAHDNRELSQRDQLFNPQVTAEGFDIINNNPIRRTTRAHKPRILDQNLYGPKTPAQIEADIQKGKDTVVNRSY
ncbi:hypothetical protein M378DRAFT_18012 [Amanita muscaria Koide BX008]|uniref:Uncharacterized protein n=1 Tax=Amanita muscaria (strain Koide BX008) TaxID=946122 RepID=A0A0C2WGX8_AMAMK|nr:hypothetical protein M378DRAFT_18012 [Amanita muscaria Koide BX008]